VFSGPPLAGSAIVQTADPASLINIILYGPDTPQSVRFGAWESMKPYMDVLNDADTAAVANYLRGSWGNQAPPVTASDVAKQR
jgi:mono/diheme cytochrome c family protein